MPEVRGETVEAAQQRLVEAGLEEEPRVQEVVVDDQAQIGRVLGQNPAAGEEIDSGDAVILQAGVANQAVSVPDVRGRTRDEAQLILQQSGLTLGVIEPGDAPGDALVDFQNPGAGGEARLGSPVNVILVDAEEPARGRGARAGARWGAGRRRAGRCRRWDRRRARRRQRGAALSTPVSASFPRR